MAARQPENAVELLKADHRTVNDLFQQYESTQDPTHKRHIAEQVFSELDMHAQLEEDIFYPAFEEKADDEGKQLVGESLQEHMMVKDMIAELLDLQGEEFHLKFQELMEAVRDHVHEEESEMFPEAERILAGDMEDLLTEMHTLKDQLRGA
jgi:hemerythrin superfamily protein